MPSDIRATRLTPLAGSDCERRRLPPAISEPIGQDAGVDDRLTVRQLDASDAQAAVDVINVAAEWYSEFLGDETHEPEMTIAEWLTEGQRMAWYGAFNGDVVVGVMGLEYTDDVALFRHAYVLPDHQRQGVGAVLGAHLESQVTGVGRIIVGTYRANYKARQALEKSGYLASPDPETILRRHYNIPENRLQSSLTYEKDV